ncbi:MAG: phosphatidate cytidylyltransferase [Faecousia sp.]
MKKRIVTAAILIPVLVLVTLVAPKIVAAVVWGVLMMIGVYELLYTTGLVQHPRMVLYSALMALATSLWSHYGANQGIALLGLLVFWILLFSELMANHVKISLEMIVYCFFAGAVVPYLLTALIRILSLASGRYLVLVPCVVAFLSDAGAYFAGSLFGRHKLAPVVSPNKTVEGVAGGLVSAMVGMLIYAVILQLVFRFQVNYGAALLYGLLGSAVGVFGDLCFSIIKRLSGIKDFGALIPGHGGFFDRFDSMVTVAPLMEALILLLPVVS